ncbi:hypothetical protein [Candidatus Ruminimicrobium bovinum]|uniref:hypothetical protein n=1 Tax=Candidatus Ruminimicrobium bovinum TaxID=3242779 RepID=UPI0039B89248
MKIKKLINKLIALSVSACLIISITSVNSFSAVKTESLSQDENNIPLISFDNGKITSINDTGSNLTVVNIQDLHCHKDTQKKIINIIEEINKENKIKQIYVEGGYGNINVSWLNKINDKKIKEQIIEQLLQDGEITAGEYYASLKNNTVQLKGLDEKTLHLQNVERLSEIMNNQDKYASVIKKVKAEIVRLNNKYINSENRKFSKQINKYKTKGNDSGKLYVLLFKYIDEINSDFEKYNNITKIVKENYPNIATYILLDQESNKIKPEEISRQIKAVLVDLKSVLSYNQYSDIITKTNNLKDISKLTWYINKYAAEKNINLNKYSALNKFIEIRKINESLNPVQLLEEERTLIEQIRYAISYDKTEYEIAYISDFEEYFEKYLKYGLTSKDWHWTKKGFNKFRQLYTKYAVVDRIKEIEKDFFELDKYYNINDERNSIFVNNILDEKIADKIKKPGTRTVKEIIKNSKEVIIVVAGGYHSDELSKILSEKSVNDIVITPNITGDVEKANNKYKQTIKEQSVLQAQALAFRIASCSDDVNQQKLILKAGIEALKKGNINEKGIENIIKVIKANDKDNNIDIQYENGEFKLNGNLITLDDIEKVSNEANDFYNAVNAVANFFRDAINVFDPKEFNTAYNATISRLLFSVAALLSDSNGLPSFEAEQILKAEDIKEIIIDGQSYSFEKFLFLPSDVQTKIIREILSKKDEEIFVRNIKDTVEKEDKKFDGKEILERYEQYCDTKQEPLNEKEKDLLERALKKVKNPNNGIEMYGVDIKALILADEKNFDELINRDVLRFFANSESYSEYDKIPAYQLVFVKDLKMENYINDGKSIEDIEKKLLELIDEIENIYDTDREYLAIENNGLAIKLFLNGYIGKELNSPDIMSEYEACVRISRHLAYYTGENSKKILEILESDKYDDKEIANKIIKSGILWYKTQIKVAKNRDILNEETKTLEMNSYQKTGSNSENMMQPSIFIAIKQHYVDQINELKEKLKTDERNKKYGFKGLDDKDIKELEDKISKYEAKKEKYENYLEENYHALNIGLYDNSEYSSGYTPEQNLDAFFNRVKTTDANKNILIRFNTHGHPTKILYYYNDGKKENLIESPITGNYIVSELISYFAENGYDEENIIFDFSTCHSYEYVLNIYKMLEEENINFFPSCITATGLESVFGYNIYMETLSDGGLGLGVIKGEVVPKRNLNSRGEVHPSTPLGQMLRKERKLSAINSWYEIQQQIKDVNNPNFNLTFYDFIKYNPRYSNHTVFLSGSATRNINQLTYKQIDYLLNGNEDEYNKITEELNNIVKEDSYDVFKEKIKNLSDKHPLENGEKTVPYAELSIREDDKTAPVWEEILFGGILTGLIAVFVASNPLGWGTIGLFVVARLGFIAMHSIAEYIRGENKNIKQNFVARLLPTGILSVPYAMVLFGGLGTFLPALAVATGVAMGIHWYWNNNQEKIEKFLNKIPFINKLPYVKMLIGDESKYKAVETGTFPFSIVGIKSNNKMNNNYILFLILTYLNGLSRYTRMDMEDYLSHADIENISNNFIENIIKNKDIKELNNYDLKALITGILLTLYPNEVEDIFNDKFNDILQYKLARVKDAQFNDSITTDFPKEALANSQLEFRSFEYKEKNTEQNELALPFRNTLIGLITDALHELRHIELERQSKNYPGFLPEFYSETGSILDVLKLAQKCKTSEEKKEFYKTLPIHYNFQLLSSEHRTARAFNQIFFDVFETDISKWEALENIIFDVNNGKEDKTPIEYIEIIINKMKDYTDEKGNSVFDISDIEQIENKMEANLQYLFYKIIKSDSKLKKEIDKKVKSGEIKIDIDEKNKSAYTNKWLYPGYEYLAFDMPSSELIKTILEYYDNNSDKNPKYYNKMKILKVHELFKDGFEFCFNTENKPSINEQEKLYSYRSRMEYYEKQLLLNDVYPVYKDLKKELGLPEKSLREINYGRVMYRKRKIDELKDIINDTNMEPEVRLLAYGYLMANSGSEQGLSKLQDLKEQTKTLLSEYVDGKKKIKNDVDLRAIGIGVALTLLDETYKAEYTTMGYEIKLTNDKFIDLEPRNISELYKIILQSNIVKEAKGKNTAVAYSNMFFASLSIVSIAHEIGHNIFNFKQGNDKNSTLRELAADTCATMLMQILGKDVTNVSVGDYLYKLFYENNVVCEYLALNEYAAERGLIYLLYIASKEINKEISFSEFFKFLLDDIGEIGNIKEHKNQSYLLKKIITNFMDWLKINSISYSGDEIKELEDIIMFTDSWKVFITELTDYLRINNKDMYAFLMGPNGEVKKRIKLPESVYDKTFVGYIENLLDKKHKEYMAILKKETSNIYTSEQKRKDLEEKYEEYNDILLNSYVLSQPDSFGTILNLVEINLNNLSDTDTDIVISEFLKQKNISLNNLDKLSELLIEDKNILVKLIIVKDKLTAKDRDILRVLFNDKGIDESSIKRWLDNNNVNISGKDQYEICRIFETKRGNLSCGERNGIISIINGSSMKEKDKEKIVSKLEKEQEIIIKVKIVKQILNEYVNKRKEKFIKMETVNTIAKNILYEISEKEDIAEDFIDENIKEQLLSNTENESNAEETKIDSVIEETEIENIQLTESYNLIGDRISTMMNGLFGNKVINFQPTIGQKARPYYYLHLGNSMAEFFMSNRNQFENIIRENGINQEIDTTIGGLNVLWYFIFEAMKNAFYHGNKLDVDKSPIYIYMDINEKDKEVYFNVVNENFENRKFDNEFDKREIEEHYERFKKDVEEAGFSNGRFAGKMEEFNKKYDDVEFVMGKDDTGKDIPYRNIGKYSVATLKFTGKAAEEIINKNKNNSDSNIPSAALLPENQREIFELIEENNFKLSFTEKLKKSVEMAWKEFSPSLYANFADIHFSKDENTAKKLQNVTKIGAAISAIAAGALMFWLNPIDSSVILVRIAMWAFPVAIITAFTTFLVNMICHTCIIYEFMKKIEENKIDPRTGEKERDKLEKIIYRKEGVNRIDLSKMSFNEQQYVAYGKNVGLFNQEFIDDFKTAFEEFEKKCEQEGKIGEIFVSVAQHKEISDSRVGYKDDYIVGLANKGIYVYVDFENNEPTTKEIDSLQKRGRAGYMYRKDGKKIMINFKNDKIEEINEKDVIDGDEFISSSFNKQEDNKAAILSETEGYVNKAIADGKNPIIISLGVAVREFLEVYRVRSFYKGHKGIESRLRALILSSASYFVPMVIGTMGLLMPAIPITMVLVGFVASIFATNIGLHTIIDFKAIKTREEMFSKMSSDIEIEKEIREIVKQKGSNKEVVMPVYVISEALEKIGYDSKELKNTGLKTAKGESVYVAEDEGRIILGTISGAGAKEIAQVLNESKVLKELIKDKISGKIQVSDMDIIVEDEKYIEQKQKEKNFKGSDIIFEEGIMIVKELKGQSRQEIMEEFKKLSEVKQAIGITLADKMIISLEDIKDIEKLNTAIKNGKARKVITRQQCEQLEIGEKELFEIRKKGIEVYIKEGEKVIEFDTRKEIEIEPISENITMQQLQQMIINSEKPLLIGIEKLAGMFKNNQADIIETYSMFETLIGNFKLNFGIGQLKEKDVEAMAYNVRYEEIPERWEDLKDSSEIKIMYNNIAEELREVFKGAIEERILAKQEIGENRLSDKKMERLLGKMLKKQKEKKIGKKKFNYEDDEKFTIEDGKREIYEIMAERNINDIEDEESILKIIELIPVVADRQMSISEEISREDIAKDYRAMLSAA